MKKDDLIDLSEDFSQEKPVATKPNPKRIRGEVCDGAFAYNCWLDSPIWGQKRDSRGEMDFGDDATIGKCLKRRYIGFHDLDMKIDFGTYLGKHGDKWVVGIVNEDRSRLTAAEVFDSLSDLQAAWVLD